MVLNGIRTFLRSSSSGEERSSTSSGQQSIPSSPSFSDFGFGVNADFHEVAHTGPAAGQQHNPFAGFASLHRGSLDSNRFEPPPASRPADTSSSAGAASSSSIWGRLSMDSALSSPHAAPVHRSPPGLAAASLPYPGASPSYHPHQSPAMNIPQQSRAASTHTSSPSDDGGFAQTAPSGACEASNRRRSGRPEGKIDGMDYYGWCELLRSSSL